MRYFIFCLCFLPLLLPLLSVYNIQPTLSLPLSNSSIHLCHQQDSAALLQFVRNFAINSSASAYCADIYRHQPAYPKTRSWNHNTDCCSWDGVSCDSLSGHVIELDLSCSQLRGTIDSNSTLFQLQTLQSLNLASNDFNNSTISPKFGHFPHLKHLNLSYTTFSGKVPVEIARLSHLISLEISPSYTLEMPDLGLIIKNMTDLKELILEDVSVSSVVPRSLLNLTSLTSLTLSGCDLRGNFPTDILHLPHLQNLDIEGDNLHANFSGFSWTSPLEVLTLSSRNFTGKLPEPARPVRYPRKLSLTFCNFSGSIPSWIWNVTGDIDLSQNQFSGELPSLLNTNKLSRKTTIDLSDNMLSGKIPSWFWNVTGYILLSSNQLSGELPSLLNTNKLPRETPIDLSDNMLSGKIPSWFWNVTGEVLLSSNQLSGELPSLLNTNKLPRETPIDLSDNMLSGKIPSWLWNVTGYILLSSNQLSGELPSLLNTNKLPRETPIDLSDNMLSGKIPSWFWNVTGEVLLSSNQLSGELPSLLNTNKLPRETPIDLSDNMLSGKIPSWFWNVTGEVHLSQNQFSGELPSLLNTNKLSGITTIELSDNMLSGKIPSWFFNVTEDIYLSSNQFSGELPSLLNTNKLPRKTTIELSNNMLSGKIPSWVFNVTEEIYLSSNQFSGELPSLLNTNKLPRITTIDLSDNMLSGKIPSWIFTLPLLENLDLSKNKFSGQLVIDNYINISSSLFSLDLSSNNLSGTIDLSMFHKFESLSILSLSENNLSLSSNNIETSIVWNQFIILGLSSCNLGNFPYFLINQEKLQDLELSNNRIHGQVPHWLLVKNTLSTLDISYNYLTGGLENIPWNNLIVIDLRSNMFSGPLPQLLPYTYAYLVSNNKFTGEIPSTICNSTNLKILDLSNNSLTGQITQCLGNMSESLNVLNLKLNKFHGTLPQDFTKYGLLEYLDVNGNQLEGSIPTSLSNCLSLQVIDLGSNKLNGKFPHWLGTLPNLQVLVLCSNRFEGLEIEVDDGQTLFPQLQILDISNNRFSGKFPRKLIKSFKSMMKNTKEREHLQYMGGYFQTYNYTVQKMYMFSIALTFKGTNRELNEVMSAISAIDVSRNRFEGDIPDEIADLVSLKWLNLSYNHFSGTIPPTLSNLSMLESLDISSNELVGHIPNELVRLTFLGCFNASGNQLDGPIPVGKQFDTFGNASYLDNPRLCGKPLSKKCGDNGDIVESPSTKYNDSRDISVWEIVLIGYGSGMIIGLSIGYLVLWGRTPLWLSRLICWVKSIMEHRSKRQHRRFIR